MMVITLFCVGVTAADSDLEWHLDTLLAVEALFKIPFTLKDYYGPQRFAPLKDTTITFAGFMVGYGALCLTTMRLS